MYKYASLYRVEEPEQELNFPGRLLKGMGLGLGTLGAMHGARVGVPWVAEGLHRGISGRPNATLPRLRSGMNTVLKHPAANYAAMALPLAYSLLSKDN